MHLLLYWKPLVEIAILWFIIYHILLFFEGTRALQVVRGILLILIAFLFFQKMGFTVLDWLLNKLFGISVIALLVIFHPEIRQGLARLGKRNFFGAGLRQEEMDSILKEISRAVDSLSKSKAGALIAIEKNDPLAAYLESGVHMDAVISSDLIENIFAPNTPLHDGGVVIQHGRIASAGCLFPLSEKQDLERIFGMRHRAAIGLSEETDAVIIVVSEERQDISLACEGVIYKDLNKEELLSKAKGLLFKQKNG